MMDALIIPTTLVAVQRGIGMEGDVKSYLPMLICLIGGMMMAMIYVKFLRTTKADAESGEED